MICDFNFVNCFEFHVFTKSSDVYINVCLCVFCWSLFSFVVERNKRVPIYLFFFSIWFDDLFVCWSFIYFLFCFTFSNDKKSSFDFLATTMSSWYIWYIRRQKPFIYVKLISDGSGPALARFCLYVFECAGSCLQNAMQLFYWIFIDRKVNRILNKYLCISWIKCCFPIVLSVHFILFFFIIVVLLLLFFLFTVFTK